MESKREKSKQKIVAEMEHKKNIDNIKRENSRNMSSNRANKSKSPNAFCKRQVQQNITNNVNFFNLDK